MATPIGYTKIGTVAYTDKGAYDPYATYNKYNVVLYEASSWVCQQDGVQGITPVEGAQWHLVARGYNLQFDAVPTKNSQNVVRSGGIFDALADLNARKQDVFINASILAQIGGITDKIIASSFIPTSGAVKEAIDNIPGGTGGSNVIVTTTETSLYGKRVRITQGSNFYETDFDGSGVAEFKGITMTGDVVITSTDGTDTAQRIVNLPYFGNYDFSISFWTATLHITTTYAIFNGQTVKAVLNGSVVGTATFGPSSTAGIYEASINVSEQGSYKVQCVYGWRTFESNTVSVTEETTYNETIDGYIAPISLTTPTSEFYGQSISVTRNGVALPVSLAFDSTGAATFTALDSGSYVFTLTYGGEPYTATVTVEAATTYSAVIKMWTATVNISTTSSVLQLQQIVVKKSGVQVGTTQFNAAGTASYIAHETGTYTFECTYDSYPYSSDPVAVTEETTYSTTITAFTATLNITTTSTELYSQTITIKKGSTTVGTTAFSSSGSATFRVHEIGMYTAECTYSGDTYYSDAVSVSEETTYPMSIDISTIETYEITATIYGAVGDTITYTDDNGQQTVTTDSTGKAENVSITITQTTAGVDPSITFTSSIAKDPTDLTADYSKAVTITENMTEIYVMPDATIYWYGNNDNCPTGGGFMQGYKGAGSNWVFNQNSLSISSKSSSLLINKEAIPTQDYSIGKIHYSASVSGGMVYTFCTTQDYGVTTNAVSNMGDRNDITVSGSGIYSLSITQASQGKEGVVIMNNSNASITISCTLYAVWFE